MSECLYLIERTREGKTDWYADKSGWVPRMVHATCFKTRAEAESSCRNIYSGGLRVVKTVQSRTAGVSTILRQLDEDR